MTEHANSSHRTAWELLPWHVNGTLEEEERRAVDAHLGNCSECREELERCRATAVAVRSGAVAPSPHPAQLAALMRRLEPAAPHDEEAPVHPRVAGASVVARTPRAVRWLVLAQAAALAVLLLLSLAARQPQPATFRTLTDAPAAVAPTRQVRVVFAPETTEAEIRELLLALRGEIAGGPSRLGAYALALPAGPDAEPLPVALAYLRQHPRVRFAEPIAAPPG